MNLIIIYVFGEVYQFINNTDKGETCNIYQNGVIEFSKRLF